MVDSSGRRDGQCVPPDSSILLGWCRRGGIRRVGFVTGRLASDSFQDFQDLVFILDWGLKVSPPLDELNQAVESRIVVAFDPVGDASLLQRSVDDLRLDFIAQHGDFFHGEPPAAHRSRRVGGRESDAPPIVDT